MTGTCCPPGSNLPGAGQVNWFWDVPCTNQDCYGVPISRQWLTSASEPTTYMKMAGQSTRQRSTLTPNNGKFYIDTTKSYATQKAAAKTHQRVQAGRDLLPAAAVREAGADADVSDLRRRQLRQGRCRPTLGDASRRQGRPLPGRRDTATWPETWTTEYDGNGVLTITMNMNFAAFSRTIWPSSRNSASRGTSANGHRTRRCPRAAPAAASRTACSRTSATTSARRAPTCARLGAEGRRLSERRLLRHRLQDGGHDLRRGQAARFGHLPAGPAVVQGHEARRRRRGAVLHAEAEVRDRAAPWSAGRRRNRARRRAAGVSPRTHRRGLRSAATSTGLRSFQEPRARECQRRVVGVDAGRGGDRHRRRPAMPRRAVDVEQFLGRQHDGSRRYAAT